MTERQNELYLYLLSKATTGKYVSKEDICKALPELYPRRSEKTTEHNSNVYSNIRDDIMAINKSDVRHIIISNQIGYKIGNPEEARNYINKRMRRDLSSLKRTRNLKKKLSVNHQMQMPEDDDDQFYRMVRTFMEEN